MPSTPRVVTVGHAIVDVLAAVEDGAVDALGLPKGTMALVDEERSAAIRAAFVDPTMVSGGSAANTAIGLASLGTPAAFVGRVRDDEMGRVFAEDIRAAGVGFDVAPVGGDGPGTGRCMVLITPDAERTMCTFLGAGGELAPSDLDAGSVAAADVVYLEGYMVGPEATAPTVEAVLDIARGAGTSVALSLSDPFWVQLHGAAIDGLLDGVDLLFGNEDEALGMTGASSLDAALDALVTRCPTVVITRGAAGAVVAAGGARHHVAAPPVAQVVDTTGAGDLFAAGYLHGVVAGFEPQRCARLGCLSAGVVIGHVGARPTAPLADLVERSA